MKSPQEIMQKTKGWLIWLASWNLSFAKDFDIQANPKHRLTYILYNFTFFALCFYYGLLQLEKIFWHGAFTGPLRAYLETHLYSHPANQSTAPHMQDLIMFWYASMPVCVVIAVGASVWFYIRHGGTVTRWDLHDGLICRSITITTIFRIFFTPIFAFVFYWVGYLSCIILPLGLYLVYVPGFFIIQIYIMVQLQILAIITLFESLIFLFPYSLHPRKRTTTTL